MGGGREWIYVVDAKSTAASFSHVAFDRARRACFAV